MLREDHTKNVLLQAHLLLIRLQHEFCVLIEINGGESPRKLLEGKAEFPRCDICSAGENVQLGWKELKYLMEN